MQDQSVKNSVAFNLKGILDCKRTMQYPSVAKFTGAAT